MENKIIDKKFSELLLDSSINVIKSDKNDLIFKFNQKFLESIKVYKNKEGNNSKNLRIISQCYIKIENISKNYVALRVRTTKKYYYNVEPIYSIISPNSFKNIKITYQSKPNEKITSLGHKFRFEGFIIEDKDKNNKNISGLFQEYINNQIMVKGNIIKKNVIFSFDNKNNNSSREKKEINVSKTGPAKVGVVNMIKNTNINVNNISLKGKNINKNELDLKQKLEQEIKECNELQSIHKNLYKKINSINIDEKTIIKNNENSIVEIMKEVKELILKIKNNKLYLEAIIFLFVLSIIIGFILTK